MQAPGLRHLKISPLTYFSELHLAINALQNILNRVKGRPLAIEASSNHIDVDCDKLYIRYISFLNDNMN